MKENKWIWLRWIRVDRIQSERERTCESGEGGRGRGREEERAIEMANNKVKNNI